MGSTLLVGLSGGLVAVLVDSIANSVAGGTDTAVEDSANVFP